MLELFGEDVPDTPTPPPTGPNEILVNITSPYSDPGDDGYLAKSWFIENDEIRISGTVYAVDNSTFDSLTINWTINPSLGKYHTEGSPELIISENNEWFFDVQLNEYEWYVDQGGNYDTGEIVVRAREGGALVGYDSVKPIVGYYDVDIEQPSIHSPLSGIIEFEGPFAGIQPELIEYRVDSGDWVLGSNVSSDRPNPTQEEGTYNFNWDSSEVIDGLHKIEVRVVNASGRVGDSQEYMYEIDNLPYAPDLEFYTETEILDGGLPVFETYLNNFLEVKVTIVNSGDAISDPVSVEVSGAELSFNNARWNGNWRDSKLIIPGWAPNTLGENGSYNYN